MYRHELRFVLRFGVREQFNEFAERLYQEETARGSAPPRIWRATSGHVNQIVIDTTTRASMRSETREPPSEVLARLSELAVPGTATEFEFDGVELGGTAE
jgi:hypothetical protein